MTEQEFHDVRNAIDAAARGFEGMSANLAKMGEFMRAWLENFDNAWQSINNLPPAEELPKCTHEAPETIQ